MGYLFLPDYRKTFGFCWIRVLQYGTLLLVIFYSSVSGFLSVHIRVTCQYDRHVQFTQSMPHTSPESAVSHAKDRDVNSVVSLLSDAQWCIAKNGGGYMQRGVAKGLKVPYLFMITEVSIRCQKTQRLVYGVYPPIHHW